MLRRLFFVLKDPSVAVSELRKEFYRRKLVEELAYLKTSRDLFEVRVYEKKYGEQIAVIEKEMKSAASNGETTVTIDSDKWPFERTLPAITQCLKYRGFEVTETRYGFDKDGYGKHSLYRISWDRYFD